MALEIRSMAKDWNCLPVRQAARHVTEFYDRFLAPAGLRTTQFSTLARSPDGSYPRTRRLHRQLLPQPRVTRTHSSSAQTFETGPGSDIGRPTYPLYFTQSR